MFRVLNFGFESSHRLSIKIFLCYLIIVEFFGVDNEVQDLLKKSLHPIKPNLQLLYTR